MKNKIFGTKAGKIIFAVCCVILAFIFWFVIKYNQLSELPSELFLFG